MKKILILSLITLSLAVIAMADIPKTIHYQGRLTDLNGNPIADGTPAISFRLWDAETNGTMVWNGTYDVATKDGYYSAELGSGLHPFTSLSFDQPYYLDMKVGSDPDYLSPRIKLNSAAYAIHASTADYATSALNCSNAVAAGNAYKLEGISAAGYIRKNMANVESADIAAGAVDSQAKAPLMPIVAYNGGDILNNPKILLGTLESSLTTGEFTIVFTGYTFSSPPKISVTVTQGIGSAVITEVTSTYAKGVTYNTTWQPAWAKIDYMIIGY